MLRRFPSIVVASFFAFVAGCSIDASGSAPGGDDLLGDASIDSTTSGGDSSIAPSDSGSGVDDTGVIVADSGPADTTVAPDTGPFDTGPADTGPADTGPLDTGPADTGPLDTGPADTGPLDTGPADTGIPCTDTGGQTAPFNGHCYFPIDAAAFSLTSCGTGAHLATITSDQEQTFVQGIGTKTDRWIGMGRRPTDPATASSYQWVTGETVSYTNWATGEPNFSGDCVRITADGHWADNPCTTSYAGVCERE